MVGSVRPPDLPSELLFLGTQTSPSAQLWRPGAGDPPLSQVAAPRPPRFLSIWPGWTSVPAGSPPAPRTTETGLSQHVRAEKPSASARSLRARAHRGQAGLRGQLASAHGRWPYGKGPLAGATCFTAGAAHPADTPRGHAPRPPRRRTEKPPACSDRAARTHRFLRRPVVHPFKNWTLKKKKVEMIKRPLKIKLAEVPPPRAQETDIFPERAALSALASQCDLIYKNAMSTELSRETCVGGSGASDIGA